MLSRFGDKFPPVQKQDGRGENFEIFINWYYLGEAGIGYMNVCIKPMQTNQYINIDQ